MVLKVSDGPGACGKAAHYWGFIADQNYSFCGLRWKESREKGGLEPKNLLQGSVFNILTALAQSSTSSLSTKPVPLEL